MPTATEHRIRLLPSQDLFVFSERKYPFFVAGLGSGKTLAGAIRGYRYAQLGDGMVVAPTYPMLRDATQHTFFGILDDAGIPYEFNKTDGEAHLFGHRVLFRSADQPDRLRGTNLMWAWLDEGALMRALVWNIVLGRLRIGTPSAWVTTTPAGFNWVHERVTAGDPSYEIIRARTADNTYLPDDYVSDLQSTYTGEFAAQELDGEFVAFEGLVYSEFRYQIHVTDADPNPRWMHVRGIDYGYTNPFVCLWGAVDEDGRLYVYDEHYRRRDLIENHARAIKEREARIAWTVADHDAQDNAEMRAQGIQTVPAHKEVSLGIQRVKSRMVVQPDGRPRLYVHERCVNLLKELGMYQWRENRRDEPLKENDHAMDVLRYMVMQLDSGATGPVRQMREASRPRSAGIREGGKW